MLYSLKELGSKGRGLVSTKFINHGEKVFQETSAAAILNSAKLDRYCHHCFRLSKTSSCCETCNTNSQQSHQALLNKCDLTVLNSEKRRFPQLIAQLVAKSITSKVGFQMFWGDVLKLAAPQNFDGGNDTEQDYKNLQTCFQPVMNKEAINAIFGSLDLNWYNRMHGILHVNSIGMNPLPSIEETKINPDPTTFPVVNDVGVGLFTTASMLNHSCEPSLAMYRDPYTFDPSVIFFATRDINVSEELTISYLPNSLTMNVHARQEELLYKYGFECDCSLCSLQIKQ